MRLTLVCAPGWRPDTPVTSVAEGRELAARWVAEISPGDQEMLSRVAQLRPDGAVYSSTGHWMVMLAVDDRVDQLRQQWVERGRAAVRAAIPDATIDRVFSDLLREGEIGEIQDDGTAVLTDQDVERIVEALWPSRPWLNPLAVDGEARRIAAGLASLRDRAHLEVRVTGEVDDHAASPYGDRDRKVTFKIGSPDGYGRRAIAEVTLTVHTTVGGRLQPSLQIDHLTVWSLADDSRHDYDRDTVSDAIGEDVLAVTEDELCQRVLADLAMQTLDAWLDNIAIDNWLEKEAADDAAGDSHAASGVGADAARNG